MPRSVARKVVWGGRTASTAFGPELVGNGDGDVLLALGYAAARGSYPAGGSGRTTGRA